MRRDTRDLSIFGSFLHFPCMSTSFIPGQIRDSVEILAGGPTALAEVQPPVHINRLSGYVAVLG